MKLVRSMVWACALCVALPAGVSFAASTTATPAPTPSVPSPHPTPKKKAKAPAPAPALAAADTSFLQQYAATYRFRLGKPNGFQVSPNGDAVLFLRSGPRSFVQDLWSFDPATGHEKVLLTAQQLLKGGEEQLSPEERARRERQRKAERGIASFQLSQDGRRLLVPLGRSLYVVERSSGAVRELPDAAGSPVDARFSPDGRRVACVRDGDLWVTDLDSDNGWRLTSGASDTLTHGLAEFVAQEEMSRFEGWWWSPDGSTIAYEEASLGGVETFDLGDPTHPERERELQRYPRSGTANAIVRLGLIPTQGGHTTWVSWDQARYPYLCAANWTKNAPLTLVVMNREQNEEAVLAVDTGTGLTRTLWVEKDRAWLNLQKGCPRWLDDGSAFLWITERNGESQLELHSADGKPVRTLHAPDLNLRELLTVDEAAGTVWVTGSPDPTQVQLYWLPLSGSGEPFRATSAIGVHGATFGLGHSIYVHTYEGIDGEIRTTVHRRGGELLGDIRSMAEKPRLTPRLEFTTVGDSLNYRAVVVRPHDFRPGRRYPVLVYVYGGPHVQQVKATPSAYLLPQWFADRGFIVVSLDGRGTPARGRAWERAIQGNLIEAPLADQVRGLKLLGAKYPELDLQRVGIYGWSFGGYFSTMAVLRRPDVFHAAIAGAPVTDWRDYDTFYTERYMGTPQSNPRGYEDASALTWAPRLERPLLLVHGTTDDNVHFANTLKLTEALFRAGKTFEFLPLAGFTHMVPDPNVTVRLNTRMAEFFERALGGPRDAAGAPVP